MLLTSSGLSAQPSIEVLQTTPLPYFRNLTALEYHDKTVMAIGNDATRILLLNRQHKTLDTLQLFDYKGQADKRIPARGIQATAVVTLEGKPVLLIMGSGQPRADKSDIWLFPLQGRRYSEVYIPAFAIPDFFKRIQKAGIKEVNIEGAAAIGSNMILASGATQGFGANYLVITEPYFWQNSLQVPLKVLELDLGDAKLSVSGLEYDKQQDVLLFSATATNQSGKTAVSPQIGVIKEASKRLKDRIISPDFMFDLASAVPGMSQQRLKSICIENDQPTDAGSLLHVCATDAAGKCVIYKLHVKWN